MQPFVARALHLTNAGLILLAWLSPQRLSAQQPASPVREKLTITKVDPPNWFARLPKAMLLVQGTGFGCAAFSLSDSALAIDKLVTSANGHWAQLWLAQSPAHPETLLLQAACPDGSRAESTYTFAEPRSATEGMHGFDPRDVLYLIMPDRFADGDPGNDGPRGTQPATSPEAQAQRASLRGWHGGDLRGIEQHLDYLQQLGITAIWTTPIYQNHSPVAYHGYHATDYFAVDEHFGTLGDLQLLAHALHRRGMKLVLDVVPNHTGPLHPWVKDSPTPDWYHGTAQVHLPAEFNMDALIDPHAPERDRVRTLKGWFPDTPPLPDNNTDDAAVALYQRQNAVWWIEQTGADALRIDTFPYVDRPFWNAYNGELSTLYPHLTEVGEVSSGDPEVNAAFAGGVVRAGVDTRLYTPFDYPMYYAAIDVFGKKLSFRRIGRVLEADELYPHPERLIPFLGNHDQPRVATLVVDPAERRLAWAFLLTTRGMPQLYAGDELAMAGGGDPANRADFPGGFAGDEQNAFTAGGRTAAQQQQFTWVQHLLQLRAQNPVLACGREQVLQADDNTFAYVRYGHAGCPDASASPALDPPVLVVLQRKPLPLTFELAGTALADCSKAKKIEGNATVQVLHQAMHVDLADGFALIACNAR